MEKKIAWNKYDEKAKKEVFSFNEDYKEFLSTCKTERECADYIIEKAEKAGFKDINSMKSYKAGDKVYAINQSRLLILFKIGKEDIAEGINIIGAHMDAPRLDLKQNPLYEDDASKTVLLKTHYYGGIKKYQWVTMPMAIHGIVCKKNGEDVKVSIGEKDDDPVFGISDLLIHLSKDQMQKTLAEGITGEGLNVFIGSIPKEDESDKEKTSAKQTVLDLLKEKYDIEEEDFVSAELQIVPAGKARDYGIDRSFVAGYAHDDRVCSYTMFRALMDMETPEKTCAAIFADKEEVGSMGATGMRSKFFENVCAKIQKGLNNEVYDSIALRDALQNSAMLSADVNAGYDPNFPEVTEKYNTAYLGKGAAFAKYTGSRGKGGSSDADPKFIAKLRKMLDDADISYQTAELGKVDQGGGGTIAYILAEYGMDVIDCGVAVHSMHSPLELVSKADVYETYRCYKEFYEKYK